MLLAPVRDMIRMVSHRNTSRNTPGHEQAERGVVLSRGRPRIDLISKTRIGGESVRRFLILDLWTHLREHYLVKTRRLSRGRDVIKA